MREALSRTGIQLDRHSISTLALTGSFPLIKCANDTQDYSFLEPRTFRALTAVAALKTQQSPEEVSLALLCFWREPSELFCSSYGVLTKLLSSGWPW